MKKTKKLDISSSKSIENMISYLEKLRDDLPNQCKQLCDELANLGIRVAVASSMGNELSDYVLFSKEIQNVDETGCTEIMFGRDIATVFGDGKDVAQISPILMMEYGSGAYADPQYAWGIGIEGGDTVVVGRGTFPGQKHAFDPNGWWYRDKNGIPHHSYGEHPSYPMQLAFDTMQSQVDRTIRRIFKL